MTARRVITVGCELTPPEVRGELPAFAHLRL